jgi:hypothetical protein
MAEHPATMVMKGDDVKYPQYAASELDGAVGHMYGMAWYEALKSEVDMATKALVEETYLPHQAITTPHHMSMSLFRNDEASFNSRDGVSPEVCAGLGGGGSVDSVMNQVGRISITMRLHYVDSPV